jgi:thiol-disulfide isomerase/thioredoxin
MKKILMLLLAVILVGACYPKLPSTTIPEVMDETAVWQSDNYQGKPVLIVFMGSWCPWCKKTIPALNALSEKYSNSVEIVGAFADQVPGPVKDVAKEHNIAFKTLYNAGAAAEQLGAQGFPYAVLFDKKHTAVRVWNGYSADFETQAAEQLDKLL